MSQVAGGPPRLIVVAKAPVAGLAKTRLTPPCSPEQGAALAEAALADTLSAAVDTGLPTILALEGAAGSWLPVDRQHLDVVPQRGCGLDERLAAAFQDAGGPALLIGMDTPQVSAPLLASCVERLLARGTDAVLGAAADGGWWAIGLRRPDRRAFLGVPMSTAVTGCRQRARLHRLGLRVADLPVLMDVDTWEDARRVAVASTSRFAAAVTSVAETLPSGRQPPVAATGLPAAAAGFAGP